MNQCINSCGLVFIFLMNGFFVSAQAKEQFSLENRVAAVESHLCSSVLDQNNPEFWSLQQRMEYYKSIGLSITVISNYQIDWTKAYGFSNKEKLQLVDSITLFQAGSISKSLNAIALLKLVQDGKIDLHSDINQYLTSWKFPYDSLSNGKKITIAHLLSHSAGLNVHGFYGYSQGKSIPTTLEILKGAKPANSEPIHSIFEPGLKFQYSGGGITISQMIVEDVTGLSYEDYLWKEVLEPLGMIKSSFSQPPNSFVQTKLASGYFPNGKMVKGNYHLYPEKAAAGLWSTTAELAKYVLETQQALEGRSEKVLNQQNTNLRLTPYLASHVGLGVFIHEENGERYFEHSGADVGFMSKYVATFEGGNGVVVMTNGMQAEILDEIIRSVAVVYNWKVLQPEQKKVIQLSELQRKNLVGKYKMDKAIIKIKEKDGELLLITPNAEKWKLFFSDQFSFFVKENPIQFEVQYSESMEVKGLKINDHNAVKM